ncbi:MAG: phosphotransferase [Rubrivivax sp.]|nr:phosphotransferase [Rubrivivax sp.]
MQLPAQISVADFDALHDAPERWRGLIDTLAAVHGLGPVQQAEESTALVALGATAVIKLYPPFLRDHHAFECGLLPRLHGRLSLPTPQLIAHGEHQGWPWLVISRLAGTTLTGTWPSLGEAQRCQLLHRLGALVAEVHALPVGEQAALAPPWPEFLARQRAGCRRRQERTGLPAHLLDQLDSFLQGPLPGGPDVILTGEYTPMNLLHGPGAGDGLSGMFDFGDGLVGPREYDWLGPLCFLAAGNAARCDAFFSGYGDTVDGPGREQLLRLLLLHRYSCLPAQIALPDWQAAPSFEALAAMLWPVGTRLR